MTVRFLDTNILLRYFTRDDEEKAGRALTLLLRDERGLERVETTLPVIFETVYTLQRRYGVVRGKIRELVTNVIAIPGVRLPEKDVCEAALTLYASSPKLSFADAYSVCYMRERGLTDIHNWDTDFDSVDGIVRIEPGGGLG